ADFLRNVVGLQQPLTSSSGCLKNKMKNSGRTTFTTRTGAVDSYSLDPGFVEQIKTERNALAENL
ncbi:unnamed protein product, partial [Amoebophrya sp. A25]